MIVRPADLPGVLLVEPEVHRDGRGFFLETHHERRYAAHGIQGPFVQDNCSFSARGVLRGLHYQHPLAQGKLVFAIQGEIFDAAVDIRLGSPTFGRWAGARLSSESMAQIWVPPGFAHGFLTLSETALVVYKCTELYDPAGDASIAWDDPDIAIGWPPGRPTLSAKDARAPRLRDVDRSRLPRHG